MSVPPWVDFTVEILRGQILNKSVLSALNWSAKDKPIEKSAGMGNRGG